MSVQRASAAIAALALAGVSIHTNAAEMALVPVSASGPHEIVGNEIILHGADQTVTLEIRMSDWDPVGIKSYQASIDAAGSTSGDAGTLMPFGWDDLDNSAFCHDDLDCPEGRVCWIPGGFQGFCAGPNHHPEDGAFIDEDRSDYVFHGIPTLGAVDLSKWDPLIGMGFRYGVTVVWLGYPAYVAPPKYGGTLTLVVPPEAAGTFTMELLGYPDTFLVLGNQWVVYPDLTAALITVLPAECGNDICDSGEDASSCPEDCLPPPIPATSVWGLVVLTLLVLSVGKVLSVKRRAAA